MGSTEEFIGLCHKLWDYLRQLTNSDHSTSFNELVDRAAEMNGVVRSEVRTLKDFGRLCNAIKNHQAYPREKIAEPTKKALSDFRCLVGSITSPKNLIPTFQAEIRCFSPNEKLVIALRYMRNNDFSQIVTQEKGRLSLLTVEGVAKWLEQQADKDIITVSKVKISDALACDLPDTFEVMGSQETIYDAQQAFKNSIEKNRPRLFAVIITDDGMRTGKPVGIVTPWDLTPEESVISDFVFRKEGEFWNISFEAKSINLKDSKGLQYISFLLRHPGKEVHVFDLILEIEGSPIDSTDTLYAKMSEGQLEDYDLQRSGLGDAGEILDFKAKKEYQNKLDDLSEDLAEAEQNNDIGLISRLKEEIKWIENKLSEAYGLGGRSRKAADSHERARQAILAAIRRSMRRIEKENPALWRHLHNTIHTGLLCSYKPEELISWSL
jgi:hypothetical protein